MSSACSTSSTPERGFFTEDHKRTVTTLAAQVAIALENASLYEQIAKPGEAPGARSGSGPRIAVSLAAAKHCPKLPNLEVAAKFSPARAIGGDLYDFVNYSLDRPGVIVIGDVSGKGAPAAIYAALVSGIVRSHAPIEPGPAEMLSAVNFSPGRAAHRGPVRLDDLCGLGRRADRTLQVANSGLPRPLYVTTARLKSIEATGLPLGLFDDAEYDEFTFKAKPGDMFVFFSDGILDARNRAGDMFGRHRTEDSCRGLCREISADCVVKSLFKAVAEHLAGDEAFDDQTVVAIKVKGTPPKRK